MSALFSALFRLAMLLVCGLIGILMCSAFIFSVIRGIGCLWQFFF